MGGQCCTQAVDPSMPGASHRLASLLEDAGGGYISAGAGISAEETILSAIR